jgi:hypothetical protein
MKTISILGEGVERSPLVGLYQDTESLDSVSGSPSKVDWLGQARKLILVRDNEDQGQVHQDGESCGEEGADDPSDPNQSRVAIQVSQTAANPTVVCRFGIGRASCPSTAAERSEIVSVTSRELCADSPKK